MQSGPYTATGSLPLPAQEVEECVAVIYGAAFRRDARRLQQHAQEIADAVGSLGRKACVVDADDGVVAGTLWEASAERAVVVTTPHPDAGSLQGLLNHMGIPYVGSGVLGTALAAHQYSARQLLRHAGVRVPHHVLINASNQPRAEASRIFNQLPLSPVRILPVTPPTQPLPARAEEESEEWRCTGLAHSRDELADLIARHRSRAALLAETEIPGRGLCVGILPERSGRPRALTLPAQAHPLGDEALNHARDMARRAHRTLHLRGPAVHHLTLEGSTRPVWLSVETHPCLSGDGLLAGMAASRWGLSHPEFIGQLLQSATTDATAHTDALPTPAAANIALVSERERR